MSPRVTILTGLLAGVVAATALLGGILAFAPEPTQLALAWERSTIFGGQFWRLWTAHWVHFSMAHALVNIAVFVAACTVAAATLGARFIGWAIFIVSPVISIGLLITSPTLVEYRGLSLMPGEDVDALEVRYPGWLLAQVNLASAHMDCLLYTSPSPRD